MGRGGLSPRCLLALLTHAAGIVDWGPYVDQLFARSIASFPVPVSDARESLQYTHCLLNVGHRLLTAPLLPCAG